MTAEFEPSRTTEELWAVPCDGTLKDEVSRPRDIKIAKGSIVWACDIQPDRWVITVESEGRRRQFVSFRNPFGVTRGERLGPKFAIYEAVKVKRTHPLSGKRGLVVGYTKVDTYSVEIVGKKHVIAGEFLSPSKVKRSG